MSKPPSESISKLFERLGWTVVVICLLTVGYAALEAHRVRLEAEEQLASWPVESARSPSRDTGDNGDLPDFAAPIAQLEIPRLDLSVVVAEGTTPDVLERSAGRLRDSALPGSDGNVVIVAHRDTFFRTLENLRRGDQIVLESAAGSESFVVEWTRVVDPTTLEVTDSTNYSALTLVTCVPSHWVGPAPRRLVVRARRTASLLSHERPGSAAPKRNL
jgi:sortase A